MPLTEAEIARFEARGYQVEGELGRGASGIVYLARHGALDRQVALKRVSLAGATEVARRRLEREIAVLVKVENPGIVRLLDAIYSDDAVVLVTEYVDGPTLGQVLALGLTARRDADALAIMEALASSLAHLAALGVVHRDLKPENVFLTRDGKCKLGDFGVAFVTEVSSPSGRLTRPGSIVGTPQYLSPEQAEGLDAGPAADVYSLGVIAYELFCDQVPFPYDGNLLALLTAQASRPAPDPRSARPDLPAPVAEALLSALAKEPGNRPAGAAVFWRDLEAAAATCWPDWRQKADLSALGSAAATSLAAPRALGTVEEYEGATIDVGVPAVVPSSFGVRAGAASGGQDDLLLAEPARSSRPTPPAAHGPDPSHPRQLPRRYLVWLVPAAIFLVAIAAAYLAVRLL